MPAKLRFRLVWLALSVVVLVIAFSAWQPPKADAFLRTPSVLNKTWYGPALLLSVPAFMCWASLAVPSKPLRLVGCMLSLAAFLAAAIAVIDSRQAPGFPLGPNSGVVWQLTEPNQPYEPTVAAFGTAECRRLASLDWSHSNV